MVWAVQLFMNICLIKMLFVYKDVILHTWTESYYKINKMELVSKQSLTTYNFKDKNHNGVLDPDEADTYSSKPVEYYKDGRKISKKEYKKILIKGKYKNMIGQKTYQQILKKLK